MVISTSAARPNTGPGQELGSLVGELGNHRGRAMLERDSQRGIKGGMAWRMENEDVLEVSSATGQNRQSYVKFADVFGLPLPSSAACIVFASGHKDMEAPMQ